MTPAVGSLWREKRPDAIVRELDGQFRRVLRVDAADAGGFVSGIGWWQVRTDEGGWQDSPNSSRRTRIRTPLFLRRYEELAR
jgi:hypothetical protein